MKSTNPVFRSSAGCVRSSSGMRERGQTRGCNCRQVEPRYSARPSGRGSALARDDDFANLDVGLNVGVVGDVGQEFGGMRREGRLECRDGIEIDVAHGEELRLRAGGCAREAVLDGDPLTGRADSGLNQGHVTVAIVINVETRAFLIRIKHTDLDHSSASIRDFGLFAGQKALFPQVMGLESLFRTQSPVIPFATTMGRDRNLYGRDGSPRQQDGQDGGQNPAERPLMAQCDI